MVCGKKILKGISCASERSQKVQLNSDFLCKWLLNLNLNFYFIKIFLVFINSTLYSHCLIIDNRTIPYRFTIFILKSFSGVRTNCFGWNSNSLLAISLSHNSRLNLDKIRASPIFVVSLPSLNGESYELDRHRIFK